MLVQNFGHNDIQNCKISCLVSLLNEKQVTIFVPFCTFQTPIDPLNQECSWGWWKADLKVELDDKFCKDKWIHIVPKQVEQPPVPLRKRKAENVNTIGGNEERWLMRVEKREEGKMPKECFYQMELLCDIVQSSCSTRPSRHISKNIFNYFALNKTHRKHFSVIQSLFGQFKVFEWVMCVLFCTCALVFSEWGHLGRRCCRQSPVGRRQRDLWWERGGGARTRGRRRSSHWQHWWAAGRVRRGSDVSWSISSKTFGDTSIVPDWPNFS